MKNWTLINTESQIATPPNIAVGFLCQRSIFGLATIPKRRASILTTGVRTRARTKETATASRVCGLKGIVLTGNRQAKELSDQVQFCVKKTIRYEAAKQAGR